MYIEIELYWNEMNCKRWVVSLTGALGQVSVYIWGVRKWGDCARIVVAVKWIEFIKSKTEHEEALHKEKQIKCEREITKKHS